MKSPTRTITTALHSGSFRALFTSIALVAGLTRPAQPVYGAPARMASPHFPVEFEANVGQADSQVKFLSRGRSHTLFLTATQALMKFGGQQSAGLLAMSLDDANPSPSIEGLDALPARSNYFHGRDPRQWHIGVPHYGKVRFREVYPGVDLVYHGAPGNNGLEYDFLVYPGADPGSIRIAFPGARKIQMDPSGDLVIETAAGQIRQRKPLAYQEENGRRQFVDVRYQPGASGRIKLAAGSYDRRRPLTIDPVVVYSTVFGAGGDLGGIAIDSAGNAYLTGDTASINFPLVNPALPSTQPVDQDVFIAKLNPTGSALVYSTFVGGSLQDFGFGIAVDGSGNAYATGYTYSTDFPTVSPLQRASGGIEDIFIVKLNAAGSTLVYSTYLGGTNSDEGHAIAVDGAGNIYITGMTATNDPSQLSDNFPLAGPLLHPPTGFSEVFVAKLNAAGSALVYSTYLGGGNTSEGGAIAADSSGNAYVTGYATEGLTMANPILAGISGAFVSKLGPTGSLLYSTYLGGGQGWGVAVDAAGNAYVTGETQDSGFLLANPLQSTLKGASIGAGSAFVTKVDPTGAKLAYSTFLGGSGGDAGRAIAVDLNGDAWIAGQTSSTDFPTVAPLQAKLALGPSSQDAFIAELNPQGTALLFSTYLGGGGAEDGRAVAVDPCGASPYVAGTTNSPDFPTTPGAFQQTVANGDFFVVKLNVPPTITSVATASGGQNIAQNTWIEIHGSNLAVPPARIWTGADFSGGMMPTSLDQVAVTVDSKAAFIYYKSCNQINVLTPLDSLTGQVAVLLKNNAAASNTFTAAMQAVSPALILAGATHYIVAQHLDGSLVGPPSLSQPGYAFTPARVDEIVILYGFGFGLPTAPLTNGAATQAGSLPSLPSVSINGIPTQVQFAGVISPGLYQLNVAIPSGVINGDNSIYVSHGGISIPTGALITVNP